VKLQCTPVCTNQDARLSEHYAVFQVTTINDTVDTADTISAMSAYSR
jgi:hypothetical protein